MYNVLSRKFYKPSAIIPDKDDKRPSETRWDFRRPLFASRI
ncbi:hypothetical protein NEIFL0001_2098 [Neisseria flavescens SK114]|nr:hypothetical protein NEIFL0001_2098 [Neisseria flavescens SK114]